MHITDEMIRPLKLNGMTDLEVGFVFGVTGGKIKALRHKYNIPSPRSEVRRDKANGENDGWPTVMSEEQRIKRWARYFEHIGHDHAADDLRFKSTGRVMAQPDRSHMHRLGATSLVAMEMF